MKMRRFFAVKVALVALLTLAFFSEPVTAAKRRYVSI